MLPPRGRLQATRRVFRVSVHVSRPGKGCPLDVRDRFVIHVNFGALLGCAYLLSPFMNLKSGKKEEKNQRLD